MRYILFLMVCLLIAGCGGDGGSSEKELCKDVSCDSWKSCNPDSGSCELKAGFCDTKEQCDTGKTCNEQHQCITETVDPCKDVTCDSWKSCNPDSGNCALKAGFCDTKEQCDTGKICNEQHQCVTEIVDLCKDVSCGANSSCNTETGKCDCNEGFEADGENCVAIDLCKDVTCDSGKECDPKTGSCVAVALKCDDQNNTLETALEVTSGVATGGAVCKDQPKWYNIALAEAGSIDVALSTTGETPYIKLYSGDGTELKGNSGEEPALKQLFVAPGNYSVQIITYNNMSSYQLTLTTTAEQCGDDTDCYATYPLRSVCGEGGVCGSLPRDHSVATGSFCEHNDNCAGENVACFEIKPGVNDGENICRSTCLYNNECPGEQWCNTFYYEVGIDRGFCTDRCDQLGGAAYCKELMQFDGAVCKENGECDWNDY